MGLSLFRRSSGRHTRKSHFHIQWSTKEKLDWECSETRAAPLAGAERLVCPVPDGNEVVMQCHFPPIWATCVEPQVRIYQAKIDKHHIQIWFQTQDRPDYTKDGTLKKQGQIKEEWVKYSFE